MVPCHKLSSAGQHAFTVAASSVRNSLADYLHHPALDLNSFRRQVKAFFVCMLRIERIRKIMTMRCIFGIC